MYTCLTCPYLADVPVSGLLVRSQNPASCHGQGHRVLFSLYTSLTCHYLADVSGPHTGTKPGGSRFQNISSSMFCSVLCFFDMCLLGVQVHMSIYVCHVYIHMSIRCISIMMCQPIHVYICIETYQPLHTRHNVNPL